MLHDMARHAVHATETLILAQDFIGCMIKDLQKIGRKVLKEEDEYEEFFASVLEPLHFSAQRARSLEERSEANKARLQNEISLVSLTAVDLTRSSGTLTGRLRRFTQSPRGTAERQSP